MTLFRIRKADQQEYGPVSTEELRQYIIGGQVFARTLAKVEGTPEWKQLSEFSEFHEALAGVSPTLEVESSARPVLPVAPRESTGSSIEPRTSLAQFFQNNRWQVTLGLILLASGMALVPFGFRSGDKEAGALTICGFGLMCLGLVRLVSTWRDESKGPGE